MVTTRSVSLSGVSAVSVGVTSVAMIVAGVMTAEQTATTSVVMGNVVTSAAAMMLAVSVGVTSVVRIVGVVAINVVTTDVAASVTLVATAAVLAATTAARTRTTRTTPRLRNTCPLTAMSRPFLPA